MVEGGKTKKKIKLVFHRLHGKSWFPRIFISIVPVALLGLIFLSVFLFVCSDHYSWFCFFSIVLLFLHLLGSLMPDSWIVVRDLWIVHVKKWILKGTHYPKFTYTRFWISCTLPLSNLILYPPKRKLLSLRELMTNHVDPCQFSNFIPQVGPYFNPSETYPYYTLPVCKPDKIETVTSLGGKLDGDKLAVSLYDIRFLGMLICVGNGNLRFLKRNVFIYWRIWRSRLWYLNCFLYLVSYLTATEDKETHELCELHLSPTDVETLREAVEKLYYFEFVIDGLTVSNYVGWLHEKVRTYMYTIYNNTCSKRFLFQLLFGLCLFFPMCS